MKCCFCKKDAGEFGNNAEPIKRGRCCDKCNDGFVIPIRILGATKSPLLTMMEQMKEAENKLKERFKNEKRN